MAVNFWNGVGEEEPHGIGKYREADRGMLLFLGTADSGRYKLYRSLNHLKRRLLSVQIIGQLLISPNPALGMAVQLFHRVKVTMLEG